MTADHPITIAARAACEALTRALDTERRAADEVEARSGQMTASMALDDDRRDAVVALRRLSAVLPMRFFGEMAAMELAATKGYAREKWTLRIMSIASETVAAERRAVRKRVLRQVAAPVAAGALSMLRAARTVCRQKGRRHEDE